jgi:hypothetical protein
MIRSASLLAVALLALTLGPSGRAEENARPGGSAGPDPGASRLPHARAARLLPQLRHRHDRPAGGPRPSPRGHRVPPRPRRLRRSRAAHRPARDRDRRGRDRRVAPAHEPDEPRGLAGEGLGSARPAHAAAGPRHGARGAGRKDLATPRPPSPRATGCSSGSRTGRRSWSSAGSSASGPTTWRRSTAATAASRWTWARCSDASACRIRPRRRRSTRASGSRSRLSSPTRSSAEGTAAALLIRRGTATAVLGKVLLGEWISEDGRVTRHVAEVGDHLVLATSPRAIDAVRAAHADREAALLTCPEYRVMRNPPAAGRRRGRLRLPLRRLRAADDRTEGEDPRVPPAPLRGEPPDDPERLGPLPPGDGGRAGKPRRSRRGGLPPERRRAPARTAAPTAWSTDTSRRAARTDGRAPSGRRPISASRR